MALTYSYIAPGPRPGSVGSYSVATSCSVGAEIIPETYNDGTHGVLYVTSIGQQAFDNCTTLTSITIPATISSIGAYAFRNCTNLTTVNCFATFLSSNLGAFKNCTNLTNIDTSRFRLGADIYYGCSNLKNVIINPIETIIPPSAFGGCSSIINITIPNKIVSISQAAFASCSNLIRINFLGNAPIIGELCFQSVNVNCKVYRYSTKSGWNETIGGVTNPVLPVLLIDSPIHQGLQTFGFPNVSAGKVSVKKQNTGGGKISLYKTPPSSVILYNSGTGNPLTYSGDGLSSNHLIGGLSGGQQDNGGWTVTFKIKKAGVLYYSFNLESEANYDYASSNINGNIIFAYQSGDVQSNGNINVNIDDIITITYSKDQSVSVGFDGIQFDFYIV